MMRSCALALAVLITGAVVTYAASGDFAADAAYDDHGVRDPLLPLVTAAGAIVTYDANFSVDEMALEGIITDGEGRVAIINGNIVEQGKMIGLYTVGRIDDDRVILLKDGQESVLQLKKEE